MEQLAHPTGVPTSTTAATDLFREVSIFNAYVAAEFFSDSLEELRARHREIINLAGLTLRESDPVGTPRSVEVQVARPEAFRDFLQNCTATALDGKELAEALRAIAVKLATSVRLIPDLGAPSDEDVALLASIRAIAREYQRLNLLDPTASLFTYSRQIENRSLAEYLAIERAGYWSPPGDRLAPGATPGEISPRSTRLAWSAAFTMLESLSNRPETLPLQGEFALHLDAIMVSAREVTARQSLPARRDLEEVLLQSHRRLLPFCVEMRAVEREISETLRIELDDLQRNARPHLSALGIRLGNELSRDGAKGFAFHHTRTGELLAFASVEPCAFAPGELEMNLAITPSYANARVEILATSRILEAMRADEYTAIRVPLPSNPREVVRAFLAHFGSRATVAQQVEGSGEDIVRVTSESLAAP